MDDLRLQPPSLQVKEGHQAVDFSVRMIVVSIVILAVGSILVMLLAVVIMRGLEWWERQHDAQLTPVQEQLSRERAIPKLPEGVKPPPDWDERAQQENHLQRTFPTPRLQYDEVSDMGRFRSAEDEHLNSIGKNPDGTVHIPVDRAIEKLSKEGLPQVSGPFMPAVAVPVEPPKSVLPMSSVQSGAGKAGH